ncbi:glutamate synthase subunit beta [Paenibacillus sp. chi10]|uniref:Glutamate synthase subunit beta n=2 Tax=Paenibacillus TaxID=44249 RepID=A0AAJ2N4C5_9BACL|nr:MULTISPECIES: glutamate synthase subunit beta [Paenibacillus]EPY13207.1 glutamate synthase [NADPH] small chain (NADPH-GOGAT) [Paenibacillus alvei A6-6i-x]MCY9529831.1 glutamate synthase subunit beta [Paenibacillus alvei]MDT8977382.1 glutamate synthase subunit beta [Paenibacillus sp. chi10]SDE75889.1 glutamate synthase (NADPH/NADH) small chain [Paenibacillus sp. cl6col]GAV11590.1 glutamate synthase (NADPH) small chain GltB [Paenibacillus sp. NAIST15-1]
MSTPTGFMEYRRQIPADRDPLERLKDWEEFHKHLSEEELRTQGARCMDCGTPYCHTGIEMTGGTSGCPVHNLIPEWNQLVYRGLWQEALERLHKTNNFPEFTGRVCPAPCEGSCTVGLIGQPVTIKTIEEAIIERGFEEGWVKPDPPAQRTGKHVAVVGSGPAGLACAAQLNKAGHSVTVFERSDRLGGLLTYGIPTMKLEKQVVDRRIQLLEAEGIQFVTNTEIGKDIPADQLVASHDAVVLCGGATKPREFQIEGSNLHGIHYAMDYLNGTIKSYLDSNLEDGQYINAEGKDVIVIGGGDTGTDCVATALRHGCRSVTQFGTHAKAPLERDASTNPWPQFPNVYTLDYAHEEAKALYGRDPREFSIMTTKFVGDEDGQVKELHTVQIERIVDETGRKIYQPIPGTERVFPAQLVLIAIGFDGPEQTIAGQLGLATDRRTNVKADYGKYATNVGKVFAAGDMRRGQSLVVWAINEGREAAREVDRYLMGTTLLP